MVDKYRAMEAWKEAPSVAMAIKGSSFAVIRKPQANKLVSHIYYQDPELRLRECCYDHLGTANKWTIGEQCSRFMSIHEREPMALKVISILVYSHWGHP